MMQILKKIYNPNEIQDEKGRMYYFDNIKFILVFLVVFGHFIDVLTAKNNNARSIWTFIYLFHMPLFIFISGYFSKNTVQNKNTKKIFTFLSLYIILRTLMFSIERFIYQKDVSLNLFTAKGTEWYIFAVGIWYAISILTSKVNKKYLFILGIILGLIVGYDKNFRDQFCLSRIIVYFPFFLLGTMVNKENIEKIITNKTVKITSIVFLAIIICMCFLCIEDVYLIRPLLTARNSYYSLHNSIENFGCLFRLGWYLVSTLISISIMTIIPRGKTFFSKFGTRTLAVYFLHAIIIKIFDLQDISLRIYQYLIISIIVTLVFSLKWFSIPFNKIMKIDFTKNTNTKYSVKTITNLIAIIMIVAILCASIYMVANTII